MGTVYEQLAGSAHLAASSSCDCSTCQTAEDTYTIHDQRCTYQLTLREYSTQMS